MAAKRLGSALSDLEGTSKQLLRVKADESGFEFYTPASLPSYTVTNGTEDRTFDADETSIDEIADVLATLIDDIDTIISGGPVAFQWSTSEQIYPFEKADDGSILYCKRIATGNLPNTGIKYINHEIDSLNTTKIYQFYGLVSEPAGDHAMNIPFVSSIGAYTIETAIGVSTFYIQTANGAWDGHLGYMYIIYSK